MATLKPLSILIFQLFFILKTLSSPVKNPHDANLSGDESDEQTQQAGDDYALKKRVICLRKSNVPYPDIAALVDKSTTSVTKLNRRWKTRIHCTPQETIEYLQEARLKWKEIGYDAFKQAKAEKRRRDHRAMRKAVMNRERDLLKYGGLDQKSIHQIVCMHLEEISNEDIARHFGYEIERIRYVIRKHASKINVIDCKATPKKDEVFERTPRAKYLPEFLERVVCLDKGGVKSTDLMHIFSLKKPALYSLLNRHANRFECSDERKLELYNEAKAIKPNLELSRQKKGVLHAYLKEETTNKVGSREGTRSDKKRLIEGVETSQVKTESMGVKKQKVEESDMKQKVKIESSPPGCTLNDEPVPIKVEEDQTESKDPLPDSLAPGLFELPFPLFSPLRDLEVPAMEFPFEFQDDGTSLHDLENFLFD